MSAPALPPADRALADAVADAAYAALWLWWESVEDPTMDQAMIELARAARAWRTEAGVAPAKRPRRLGRPGPPPGPGMVRVVFDVPAAELAIAEALVAAMRGEVRS